MPQVPFPGTTIRIGIACAAVVLGLPGAIVHASNSAQPDQQELKRLSVEELMTVDVTLTSRRPEPVGTTPAAVSVVSGEDIRRSGVTTIADAVSMAGGVHGARFNNGTWSISTRGFNAVTANKLLVMIDGRTVYSPLFSGVFWNIVDYTLEDIDRIEVVRGPGATLWGSNAVNGVVNIVTRSARDTAGTFVQLATGNEDPVVADLRHGGYVGSTAYRVYGKFAMRNSQLFSDGTDAGDRRTRGQAGFRLDRDGGTMLKGDVYYGTNRFPDRDNGTFFFVDVQGRWTRPISDRSDLLVQTYVNHERRTVPLQLTHRLTTFDVDAQHTITLPAHSIVWGGGLRVNHDATEGTAVIWFEPVSRTYPVVNGFVQDEVELAASRLFVMPGIKIERNAFSGVEIQPGIRARLFLPRNQMLWGSVARALRRPTRFDEDVRVGTPQGALVARGNPDFSAERLIASEIGYRPQIFPFLSTDITVFHHAYDRVRSQEIPTTFPPTPVVVGNTLNGTSTGVEFSAALQPVAWWRTDVSYTGQDVSFTRDATSRDVGYGVTESNDPAHLWTLRTSVDLPRGVEVDVRLRHVSALPNPVVPAFTELGFRLGWPVSRRVALALVGEDMLHDHHPEFNPTARGFEEVERSLRVVLTLRDR